MNVDNFKALIARVEALPPEQIDMSTWFSDPVTKEATGSKHTSMVGHLYRTHWCGTAACLAGHTNILRRALRWSGEWYQEADWLGLTYAAAHDLFVPFGIAASDYGVYDKTRVLATLRYALKSFEEGAAVVIDWNRPRSEGAH